MPKRKQATPLTAADLLAIGVNSLAPGARWCILHEEGPLLDTASIDFTWPIEVVCGAMKMDWASYRKVAFILVRSIRKEGRWRSGCGEVRHEPASNRCVT